MPNKSAALKEALKQRKKIRFDDPTMWRDERGGWHALMHCGNGHMPASDVTTYGIRYRDGNPHPIGTIAHLFSVDGLNWYGSYVMLLPAAIFGVIVLVRCCPISCLSMRHSVCGLLSLNWSGMFPLSQLLMHRCRSVTASG